jgi:hypothetical protein
VFLGIKFKSEGTLGKARLGGSSVDGEERTDLDSKRVSKVQRLQKVRDRLFVVP